MTEWEQMKKEYREIPIPAEGTHQVLEAMAEAKRKRNRFRNLARYGTVAAAALLVLLLPGTMLLSGGFGAKEENASMEADCIMESTKSDGWFGKESADDATMAPATSNAESNDRVTEEPYYSLQDNNAASETKANVVIDAGKAETKVPWAEKREDISKEILRQMEECMRFNGETYYCKSELYPDGFDLLDEEQTYYYNEDFLLVIVFEAGEVAPKEQGVIEFIIPKEVYFPTE